MTLIKILEIMGCTIGNFSYEYAIKKDIERVSLAEKATNAATKSGRLEKKQDLLEQHQALEDEGLLLYGPGIAD